MSDDKTAVTRADLTEALLNELGINQREASELVQTFFEEIATGLERNESVKLPRFGTFVVREKNARPGRNLRTGEAVTINARRVVTFRASSTLKDRIAKYVGPGIE